MNRKHKLFYVFSSFIVGLFVGIAGVSSPTHLSKRNLPVSVKPVNVTTEDATFSHTYTEKVMHDSMYTFVYTIATDQVWLVKKSCSSALCSVLCWRTSRRCTYVHAHPHFSSSSFDSNSVNGLIIAHQIN